MYCAKSSTDEPAVIMMKKTFLQKGCSAGVVRTITRCSHLLLLFRTTWGALTWLLVLVLVPVIIPSTHIKMRIPLEIWNVTCHEKRLRRICSNGPKQRIPNPWPEEIIPVARAMCFSKFNGTATIAAVNTKLDPMPNTKEYVKKRRAKESMNEEERSDTAQSKPPVIRVVLQLNR